VPTIEEFVKILDMPLEKRVLYQHLEQPASVLTLSKIMKMLSRELEKSIAMKDKISLEFLEARLHQLSDEEDWETIMDVFALTIYGVLLFPNFENFVDYAAVSTFVAFKI